MLSNHFKIAWRNLFNNKSLSFINISGLALGMAFAMLIGLWIQFETSFDSFHINRDRIALVMKHSLFNDQKNTQESTPLPLYDEIKNNYPDVKRATRITWESNKSLVWGDHKFNKKSRSVDPDFLQMFSFPIIRGDARTPLHDPSSIVLTESLAKALFGNNDPIGQTLRIENQYPGRVTAVVRDVPANSSIRFDFLLSYESEIAHSDFIKNNKTNWSNNFMMNMVELKEGVSMDAFSKKIAPLNVQKDKAIKNQVLFLHPLNKWRLHNEYKNWQNTGGRIEYIRLFSIIGIFVLLIACINFMNLSTARSEKRAKEVGIRKAIGSRRVDLIAQFLSESLLTTFLAFLLSVALIKALLPYLKDLGFENIHFDIGNASLLTVGLLSSAITGLIAGSYPAFYLSSFIPVKVLKGLMKQGQGAVSFRKILVVSQFAISVGLIISAIIVFQQINHARNRTLGYNPNNLINIQATRDLAQNFVSLKQELLNSNYFDAVSKVSQPMTSVYNKWSDFSWTGKPAGSDIALDAIMTEWDFEKTAGLTFTQGRPFSIDYKTDSNGVILNEAALKVIGYTDPVGKTMKSGDRIINIVGIVDNIVLEDPFKPVNPLAILFNGSEFDNVNNIYLRLKKDADLKKALAFIQPVFEKYNPALPFEYTFMDEEFAKKFDTEQQVGKLSGIFAGLAILISCMGLFGLAIFMAERRTREIGIRKVLGASVSNLWVLLSKEFIWLVVIACLIASPISFWMMKSWLQRYEYRISINWQVFALAAASVLVIAMITVSFQAIKAAIANPVKCLRTE